MPQDAKDETLLQVSLDSDLFARFARQRERWGMTNREIITRMIIDALPIWESADGPPGTSPK